MPRDLTIRTWTNKRLKDKVADLLPRTSTQLDAERATPTPVVGNNEGREYAVTAHRAHPAATADLVEGVPWNISPFFFHVMYCTVRRYSRA